METDIEEAIRDVRTLVDEYRGQCFWFLRQDYYPTTLAEAHRALVYIERYGDREAHRKANRLKRWLSQLSSGTSAG